MSFTAPGCCAGAGVSADRTFEKGVIFSDSFGGNCLFSTGHNLSVNLVVSRRLSLEVDQLWRVGMGASIWVTLALFIKLVSCDVVGSSS